MIEITFPDSDIDEHEDLTSGSITFNAELGPLENFFSSQPVTLEIKSSPRPIKSKKKRIRKKWRKKCRVTRIEGVNITGFNHQKGEFEATR